MNAIRRKGGQLGRDPVKYVKENRDLRVDLKHLLFDEK